MRNRAILALLMLGTNACQLAEKTSPERIPAAADQIGEPKSQLTFNVSAAEQTLIQLEREGFSGTVALAHGGRLILSRSMGIAAPARAMRPTTAVDVMSNAKVFTALAILLLADEGRLGTGDTLAKWFPNAPADKRDITVDQLLKHRSGILDYPEDWSDYEAISASAAGQRLLAEPLQFEPGRAEQYSNGGYLLLAQIVEKVSGESLESYLERRIFAPAKARASYSPLRFDDVAGGRNHFAGTLEWMDLKAIADPRRGPFGALWGAGGLFMPVEDLARTVSMLFGGQLVPARVMEQAVAVSAQSPRRTRVFEIANFGKPDQFFAHGGDSTFARSALRHYPQHGLTVGIWANSISPSAHNAVRRITEALFGASTDKQAAADLPGEAFEPSAPEVRLLRCYFDALASENLAARRQFAQTKLSAAYVRERGGLAKFVANMGSQWWSIGKPKVLSVRRVPQGLAALVRINDSSHPRLIQLSMAFEQIEGTARIASMKWSVADAGAQE